MRAMWIIISGLILFLSTVNAKTFDDCAKIKDNQERLICFDEALKAAEKSDGSEPDADQQESVEKSEQTSTEQPTVKSNNDAAKKPLVIDPEDAFGKKKSELVQVKSIESHIVGEFKGWKKGLKLKLANGQVWKVVSYASVYTNKNNPKVVVSEGFMGSYKMKVEGLNAVAKVKRIK